MECRFFQGMVGRARPGIRSSPIPAPYQVFPVYRPSSFVCNYLPVEPIVALVAKYRIRTLTPITRRGDCGGPQCDNMILCIGVLPRPPNFCFLMYWYYPPSWIPEIGQRVKSCGMLMLPQHIRTYLVLSFFLMILELLDHARTAKICCRIYQPIIR